MSRKDLIFIIPILLTSPSFGTGDYIETIFKDLQRLEIYLKDDFPEDGRGGALFAYELRM